MKIGDLYTRHKSVKNNSCPACGETKTRACSLLTYMRTYDCGFSANWEKTSNEILTMCVRTICNKAEIGDCDKIAKTAKTGHKKCDCPRQILFLQGCKCGGN